MKQILTFGSLLLAFLFATSSAFAQEKGIDRCIPCEQANTDVQTLGLATKTLSQTSGFRLANGNQVTKFALSNSLVQIPKFDEQSIPKGNPQPVLSLGCYYSFTGGTTCFNHTMYGYYCLVGSWYCQLLGSCRWIAIGSCK